MRRECEEMGKPTGLFGMAKKVYCVTGSKAAAAADNETVAKTTAPGRWFLRVGRY